MINDKFKLLFKSFFKYYKAIINLDYKADTYVFNHLDLYENDYEGFGKHLIRVYRLFCRDNLFFVCNPFTDCKITNGSYSYSDKIIVLNEKDTGLVGTKLGLDNYGFSLYFDKEFIEFIQSEDGLNLLEQIGFNDFISANKELNFEVNNVYEQSTEKEVELIDRFFDSIKTGTNNLIYTSIASPLLRQIECGDGFSMIDCDAMNKYLDDFKEIIDDLENCHDLLELENYQIASAIGGNDSCRGLVIPPHSLFDRRFTDDFDGNKDYENDENTDKKLQPFEMFKRMRGILDGEKKDSLEQLQELFDSVEVEKKSYIDKKREQEEKKEEFQKLNDFYTQHCYYCVLSDVCKLQNTLTKECHHFYPDFDHIPRKKF